MHEAGRPQDQAGTGPLVGTLSRQTNWKPPADVAEQFTQSVPPPPQAVLDDPTWQWPLASQQPSGHVLCEHAAASAAGVTASGLAWRPVAPHASPLNSVLAFASVLASRFVLASRIVFASDSASA
jgi:hypothetical protein